MNRRHGFTMTELVIVVLVVAILAASAIPSFQDSLQSMRVEQAVQRLKADFKLARQNAVRKSTSQQIVFSTSPDRYELVTVENFSHGTADYSVILGESPYDVSLANVDFGGDTTVTFNLHGVPDSGGTLDINCGDASTTLTLDAETGDLQ